MRSLSKLAIGAAVVLSVAAAMQPAQAACPPPGLIVDVFGAYIVSNPSWDGTLSGVYTSGPYANPAGEMVSASLDGFFWAQTGGDGARNAGADSGSWAPFNGWTKSIKGAFGNGDYAYPAFLTNNDYPQYSAAVPGNPINWAGSDLIDGCVADVTPLVDFDECTCILLTDQWNGQGYFAMLSKKADVQGNFNWEEYRPVPGEPGAVIQFAPIPKPEITGSSRNAADGTVTFNINVPPPAAGDYRDPQCGCGFGYRVYANVVARGDMPPANRHACTQETLFKATGQNLSPSSTGFAAACRAAGFGWIPASSSTGTPQGFTTFGATRTTSTVSVNCGDPQMSYDLYLAASVGANEGPAGAGVQVSNVSTSSLQVQCGATYAEPSRPESPGRSGQAPRGRSENRR